MIKAQYTVVLKSLLDDPQTKALIDKAMSTYPLYEKKSKEEYIPSIIPTREQLNAKILNYYKYREIGFETVGRFLDELETSLCEIMPLYNQLLFSTDQDFNIIYNVDYNRTIERDLNGNVKTNSQGSSENETVSNDTSESVTDNTATNTTTATDKNTTQTDMENTAKKVKSETPQGMLDITGKNIDSVPYADNVEWNKDTSDSTVTSNGENSSTGTTTSNGSNTVTGNSTVTQNGNNTVTGEDVKTEKEQTTESVKGNYGQVSAQSLIDRYRDIIINVEQKIINDRRIAELFMLVY